MSTKTPRANIADVLTTRIAILASEVLGAAPPRAPALSNEPPCGLTVGTTLAEALAAANLNAARVLSVLLSARMKRGYTLALTLTAITMPFSQWSA
jgi:hypothetical protein